ncbi:40S ribosomal protein S15 [Sciurus carolinensis]|uniref:40S ribosomal protein S15 n=1 Tax=Sciurus carolinensis TaxID=30640 RepID=A0AA41N2I6_SCICA|nr:40S ribosomal protein S15 [Sciurus carolinensis]
MEVKKKWSFHKSICLGMDLNQLLDTSCEQLRQLYNVWQCWRLNSGLCWKQYSLLKCLSKVKKEALPTKTHLQDR